MALFPHFLIAAVVLTILFSASPSISTSRGPLLDRQPIDKHKTGFSVSLTHVDSGANLTKFELLQRAMKRGNNRLNQLNTLKTSTDDLITTLVYPGNGEFLMNLSIGTPQTEFTAIMDTGSDLIWTQCRPCTNCYDQSTPIFDPEGSSSFLRLNCYSHQCQELQSVCRSDGCEYTYSYGDYSSTQGIMATETFTFGNTSVANIGFGCGHDNEGNGFSQGAGLMGFGRGPLSLVSQLRVPAFSYCLTSIYTKQTSTLLVGSLATDFIGTNNESLHRTTHFITNPSRPSLYYLNLEGITVGNVALPIDRSNFALRDDGSGGMIIDSGTTVTYLENSVFELVKAEFVNQIDFKVDDTGVTGFDLCFQVPHGTLYIEVPKLIFHFEDAELVLPANNYMQADSTLGLMCLIMDGSNGLSIFGNVMQQNIMVVHDLSKETISFIPTQCDQL